ncbi:ParA family protein [Phytomonospora sp. NPDC050363]|uniref:ParA family protein n=1 Tax=Phytomonospora sp. NPDC050363 TaxID=3155642 RepID=UPI0033DDA88A
MTIVALCSAKNSPGVTTAALAMTWSWRGANLLVEADPAGGSVMAGYLEGRMPTDCGLLELAQAALNGDDLHAITWAQMIDLEGGGRQRLLLPGLSSPVQSGTVQPVWTRIGEHLRQLSEFTTDDAGAKPNVIIDCGRLTSVNVPWPLLASADVVLLAVSATLPGVNAAFPVVKTLRDQLQTANGPSLAVILIGHEAAAYPARDIARQLGVPVLVELPYDPASARALSFGGRKLMLRKPLFAAAARAQDTITAHTPRRRARQISAVPTLGGTR